MTYRISNQAGQLVTIALPVFFLMIALLGLAFHGSIDSVAVEKQREASPVTTIEKAYLGLNP